MVSTSVPKSERYCLSCGNNECKKRCSQCQIVYFCNRECQLQAWPSHKESCYKESIKPLSLENSQEEEENKDVEIQHIVINEVSKMTSEKKSNATAAPVKRENIMITSAQESETKECADEMNDQKRSSQNVDVMKKKSTKKKKKAEKKMKKTVVSEEKIDASKEEMEEIEVTSRIQWGSVSVTEFLREIGGGGGVPGIVLYYFNILFVDMMELIMNYQFSRWNLVARTRKENSNLCCWYSRCL